MAEFGWAFISGAVTGKGAADAVQFIKTANGQVTGSSNFKFNSSTNSRWNSPYTWNWNFI